MHTWATVNGYVFSDTGEMGSNGLTDQHPVTNLDWRNAMVFCNALTEYYNLNNQTNLACVYTSDAGFTSPIRDLTESMDDGDYSNTYNATAGGFDDPYVNTNALGFRLPSYDEWECAARYIDGVQWTPGDYASGANVDVTTPDSAANISNDDVAVLAEGDDYDTAPVGSKLPNALALYDMSGNVWEWCIDEYSSIPGFRYVRGGNTEGDVEVGHYSAYEAYYQDTYIGFRLVRSVD